MGGVRLGGEGWGGGRTPGQRLKQRIQPLVVWAVLGSAQLSSAQLRSAQVRSGQLR